MSKYFKKNLIFGFIKLKKPILDSGVYITYYPLDLPFNGAVFFITTCFLYKLLNNAI